MSAQSRAEAMLVYRLDLRERPADGPPAPGRFVLAARPNQIPGLWGSWVRTWGWKQALQALAKVLTRRRVFFGVSIEGRIMQYGWANLGFCRHYPVEADSVVLGPLWTSPDRRGQGLAPAALRQVIAVLYQMGYRRFYIDTTPANQPAQRMIAKAGFGPALPELPQ